MKKKYKCFFLLVFFCFNIYLCFTQEAHPYSNDEFPQFMKDLRRAEIISLGAMPFVTFNVSLSYSFFKYADNNFDPDYIPNPFAKSSDVNALSTDEQIGIILTSLGVSAGIGLTDFIVQIVKRNAKKKKGSNKLVPIQITGSDNEFEITENKLERIEKIEKNSASVKDNIRETQYEREKIVSPVKQESDDKKNISPDNN